MQPIIGSEWKGPIREGDTAMKFEKRGKKEKKSKFFSTGRDYGQKGNKPGLGGVNTHSWQDRSPGQKRKTRRKKLKRVRKKDSKQRIIERTSGHRKQAN